jgi:hypothetical protein
MAVEWPIPMELTLFLPVLLGGTLLAAKLGPPIVAARRQAAYDRVVASEQVRLEIVPSAGRTADPGATLELIRAVHPRHRRGVSTWAVGWPASELRAVWRDGCLAWQLELPKQLAHAAEAALRVAMPDAEVDVAERADAPAAATAVGRLVAPGYWPLGDPEQPGATLLRLATLAEQAANGAEVRLRIGLRPIAPERWQHMLWPEEQRGASVAGLIAAALLDTIFNRESTAGTDRPVVLSAAEREARDRKRQAQVGFDVGLLLEAAGTDAAEATALLWRLVDFSDPAGDGRQAIDWRIRPGSSPMRRPLGLGDWEVARLWQLPDQRFDAADLPRRRPAVAKAPPQPAGRSTAITVGTARGVPLRLALDQLARHLAVLGATGSGKSTLLLNLALGVLDTPAGATIIDPHGDLAADILSRVPVRHAGRVHVLRLADRANPRGFNFLERRSTDEAQLVASEFVGLLADLWPRYCGPRMQHYLRHALLTVLSQPEPQTILELVRIMTDDALRRRYVERLKASGADPMLVAWWHTQWPSSSARERDPSIGAVLNKLGAFLAYLSIRHVVGQGASTLRPRQMMDAGELLVVDLSGVGADNADLFGAMLISRYAIDARGRGDLPPSERRPHLLIVDEAQRFATRAVEGISVEGRKFGLGLAVAAQSLTGLNERLRNALLTNAATLAVLSPGADDARHLTRLFAPLREEDLLGLQRHELLLRMPDTEGRPTAFGGRVSLPEPGDPQRAAALIADSDRRDARPLAEVRDEIRRRTEPTEDEQRQGTGAGDGHAGDAL